MTVYYPEGAYRAEIKDQGLSQSKNGNPQIWLRILVLGPSVSQEQFDQHERTIFWTITEKTIDYITEKLQALGFDGESFRQLDLNHQNPQSFVGDVHEFYCKIETYEGEEREKWDLSRGNFEMKPLDEAEARKLDALFGRKLKGKSGGPSAARPKANGKSTADGNAVLQEAGFESQENDGDDIPF